MADQVYQVVSARTASDPAEGFSWRGAWHAPLTQAWLLLGPAMLIYAVFALYPMVDTFVLSFQTWNGLTPHRGFAGLDNYAFIFNDDPVFWLALRNTVIWTFLAVSIPPLIGFGLALAVNQQIPGRNAMRAIFYLPVILAPIAVATMWKWMYDPFFGLFNQLLTSAGLQGLIKDWLGDRQVALYSVFGAYVWQHVGFSMVLFLAGLQGVNQTLVEAARIDGANRYQVFQHVTLPAMSTSITIVLVLSLIQSLKAFDIVYGMTLGGPAQSTQMLALWAFTQSMQIHDFGRGSAVAVVLLLITLAIVVPYMLWRMKREEGQG
ncbi:MAG: sugar ABC transporter permease [Acidobacteriota bacterium]|nr:sugar ABC transporter permease [Acidobacteriota bacterium]